MKSFKLFLSECNKHSKYTFNKKKESILSWNSSFNEARNNELNESVLYEAAYNPIHDEPHLKPAALTPLNRRAIFRYTSAKSAHKIRGAGSSKNINGYLRNRMGSIKSKVADHDPTAVHKAVQELSAAFTPQNTNKEAITAYAGIPSHVAEKLTTAGPNSHHTFAGFTSTSTAPGIATNFAKSYKTKTPGQIHVLKMTVEPGAGLSVAANSHFEHENEVLLHHGAHITYHGSEEQMGQYGGPITHVHHITVHATHTPLSEYGEYKEPKLTKAEITKAEKSKPDPSLDEHFAKTLEEHPAKEEYAVKHVFKNPKATPNAIVNALRYVTKASKAEKALAHPNADASVVRTIMANPKFKILHGVAAQHPAIDTNTLHNFINTHIDNPGIVNVLDSPALSKEDNDRIITRHPDKVPNHVKAEQLV